MADDDPCDDKRRHLRVPVRWSCAVVADDVEEDCIMLDVSPSGALIQAPVAYEIDSPLALSTALGGAFSGRVAWQRGTLTGVAFNRIVPDFLGGHEG